MPYPYMSIIQYNNVTTLQCFVCKMYSYEAAEGMSVQCQLDDPVMHNLNNCALKGITFVCIKTFYIQCFFFFSQG